jgi:hypothetical protein
MLITAVKVRARHGLRFGHGHQPIGDRLVTGQCPVTFDKGPAPLLGPTCEAGTDAFWEGPPDRDKLSVQVGLSSTGKRL